MIFTLATAQVTLARKFHTTFSLSFYWRSGVKFMYVRSMGSSLNLWHQLRVRTRFETSALAHEKFPQAWFPRAGPWGAKCASEIWARPKRSTSRFRVSQNVPSYPKGPHYISLNGLQSDICLLFPKIAWVVRFVTRWMCGVLEPGLLFAAYSADTPT